MKQYWENWSSNCFTLEHATITVDHMSPRWKSKFNAHLLLGQKFKILSTVLLLFSELKEIKALCLRSSHCSEHHQAYLQSKHIAKGWGNGYDDEFQGNEEVNDLKIKIHIHDNVKLIIWSHRGMQFLIRGGQGSGATKITNNRPLRTG